MVVSSLTGVPSWVSPKPELLGTLFQQGSSSLPSMSGGVGTRTAWICRLIVCAPTATLASRKRIQQIDVNRTTLPTFPLFDGANHTQLNCLLPLLPLTA